MKNRKERLPIIVDLLTHKMIGTQEELMAELEVLGYKATQATLSRDLKQLKTSKVPNGMGGYSYVLPSQIHNASDVHRMGTHLPAHSAVRSIVRSSNIIVIKAPADQAKILSTAFEAIQDPRLLASFSVTDNVLLVLTSDVSADGVNEILSRVISVDIVKQYNMALTS